MNPKLQIVLCAVILLVALPGGIYAVRQSLRSGRCSWFRQPSGPTVTWTRDKRPHDFWVCIGITMLAMCVGVFIAIAGLVDALGSL